MVRYNNVTVRRQTKRRKQEKQIMGLKKATFRDVVYMTLSGLIFIGVVGTVSKNAELAKTQLVSGVVQTAEAFSKNIEATHSAEVKEKPLDKESRIRKLQLFLKDKESPLQDYAKYIVEEADRYAIGWTDIVSISCIESSCGTNLPTGSYNAWGIMAWDSYGNRYFRRFNSWEEGIHYTSSLLGNYYKKDIYAGIKARYCPSSDGCNPEWVNVVADSSNEILSIENE